MKYGWVIYPRKTMNSKFGNNAFDWMKESALKYKIELEIIFSDDLIVLNCNNKIKFISCGKELNYPDFVLMRDYNYEISSQLELMGIKVINSTQSMINSQNKAATSQLLVKNKVPTPKFLFSKARDYNKIYDFFDKKKFVMKKIDGSQGEGVYLINYESDYNSAFNEIRGTYFCQEFIEHSFGQDIRVYVLGNKVIGCVKRISDNSFKSNFSLGGRAEKYDLDEKIIEISTQAAKALQIDFCGIDLLITENSYTVCEINGNAGFRTITQVSDIDIADELFKYVNEIIYLDDLMI